MDLLKMFSSHSKSSPKDVAKDRLKLILIHDRGTVSPELLELIKGEILKVIAKYAEFDLSDVEINLTTTGDTDGNVPALVASIPIKQIRSK
jgi:cell division topological specificity factor